MAKRKRSPVPTATAPASLDFIGSLSDDCLWLVVKEVAKLKRAKWGDPKPLKQLSIVNKRFRQLSIPFLFKSDELALSRPKANLIQHLKALTRASFITSKLLVFDLRMRQTNGNVEPDFGKFGEDLVDAIAAMPKLLCLHLGLCNDARLVSRFRAAATARGLCLPSVTLLEVEQVPNAAFLLRACSELKTFVTDYPCKQWKQTFTALLENPTVLSVELENGGGWKAKQIDQVIDFLAGVQNLCIKGSLHRIKLTDLAPSFARLINLELLAITKVQWVNLAYLSKHYVDDRLLYKIDDRLENSPFNEDEELVAQVFFQNCKTLKVLHTLEEFEITSTFARKDNGAIDKQARRTTRCIRAWISTIW